MDSIVFVYFEHGVCNAVVVLRLILVVKLEVHARADQVKRVGHYAAYYISGK